ncbi:MAG: restriction endonuclease subunit S [Microbacterium chocolatum]|nr:restriction endonuclease subunit S [Microbacterium chocolatum]
MTLVPIADLVAPVTRKGPSRDSTTFTYVDLSSVDAAGKRIVAPSEVLTSEAPSRARQNLRTGDVLVSTVRPNLNGVASVDNHLDGAVGSTGFAVLRANDELLDKRYLFHWVRTPQFVESMTRLATGASYPAVTEAIVKASQIPLPPLPEQRRIAEILDEADALDRPVTDAHGKLSSLRQSLFSSAVSEVKTRVSIADAALKVTDGTHQAPGWSTAGVPFLFVSNITSGSINYSTSKYVSLETYNRLTRHSPIEKGDVLYSAVGSYGVPAVVDSDEPFLFQRHIAHIKPRPDVVDSWYLHAALASPDFLNQAHRVARGVAQKTVTLGDLSRLTIPLPSVEAQQHVAKQLEAVRGAHASLTHQRSSIRNLFASLQHRAFRGEL